METTRRLGFVALLAAAIALASGCGGDGGGEPQGKAPEQEAPEQEGAAAQDGKEPSEETPAPGGERPDELSAAHILISYAGSAQAGPEITRSKQEALALAQEIATKAKAEDADFAELAKQYSDGPSGPRGGSLGNFAPDEMVEPFAEATLKLAIGAVSDPVETPFGYHVIRRQEIQIIPKASARHVLVQYQGSMRADPTITRTKEEALVRIQECLKRYQAGEKFEELAGEYSDGPTGPSGGDLGEFPEGVMAPTFDEAVFACEVGKITDVVETPFGYHVIYRYK